MAHLEHYNMRSARYILDEHDRESENYKNYVDLTRSDFNYNYGISKRAECIEKIKERCNEIMKGRPLHKQAQPMCEWLVTYPSWLCEPAKGGNGKQYNKPKSEEHCKRFFDTVYKFNQERYGENNVIGGYVHMDETTPHMHVAFVPEATSRKTGKKTVSSASLITRAELRNYQRDLQKRMVEVFGKSASAYILNGRTKGDYTVEELKERTKRNKQAKVQQNKLDMREKAQNQRESDLSKKEDIILQQEIKIAENLQNSSNLLKKTQEYHNSGLEEYAKRFKDSQGVSFFERYLTYRESRKKSLQQDVNKAVESALERNSMRQQAKQAEERKKALDDELQRILAKIAENERKEKEEDDDYSVRYR